MTRKNFELIAAAIKSAADEAQRNIADNPTQSYNLAGVHETAYQAARALISTNPRFDRARLLAACGVDA